MASLFFYLPRPDGTLYFGVHILSHQAEQKVENGLIVLFGFVLQIIRYRSEKGTGALQTTFNIAFAYFSVGVCQPIYLEIRIIAFDSKITTLISYSEDNTYSSNSHIYTNQDNRFTQKRSILQYIPSSGFVFFSEKHNFCLQKMIIIHFRTCI